MRDIVDYQEKYKQEPFEQYQVLYRRKKVIELLNKYNHRNILEVGCGLKPLFSSVEDFDTMTIIEPAKDFYDNAVQEARQSERSIQCILGFLEDNVDRILSLEVNFDYIIVSSLLHEVERPEMMLKSIHQLCNENTIVHINVPNAKSFHRLIAYEMGAIDDIYQLSDLQNQMQRFRVYDMDILKEITLSNGFTTIESGSYFPKFLAHRQLQDCVNHGIIDDGVLEGLYKLEKYVPEFGSEIYVQLKCL